MLRCVDSSQAKPAVLHSWEAVNHEIVFLMFPITVTNYQIVH